VAMLCGNSRRAVLLARVEYALSYDYPLSKLLLIGISVGRRGTAEWAHRLSLASWELSAPWKTTAPPTGMPD
jgi:hypothetical protein